jgi:hypothetical protein
MPACCGEERATAFCPDCGKRLAVDARTGLVAHCRRQVEQWQRCVDEPDIGDRHLTSAKKNLAKWQSWLDWVLKQGE